MGKRKKCDPEFEPEVIEIFDCEPQFFAFVPNEIEAQDGCDPRLIGFPLNIVFGGNTHDSQPGHESLASVCYEPAPETFEENSQTKELCYYTKPENGYSIRVVCEKATGRWRTEKFRDSDLIRTAFGSTLDEAMLQTTMDGVEADER